MTKNWITKESFTLAIDALASAGLNPNCTALVGLKLAGLNTDTWQQLRSGVEWKLQALSAFTVSDEGGRKVGIFNPFTKTLHSNGDYAHGTLYSPLREQRKPFGKKALVWQRDEIGLAPNDTTNYNVRFSPLYVSTATQTWIKSGKKIPLVALCVYLQAKLGPFEGDATAEELVAHWKTALKLDQDELTSWFKLDALSLPLFSSQEWTIEEVDQFIIERYGTTTDGIETVSAASSSASNLIVYGAPGCGKSTFIDELCAGKTIVRCVFYGETTRFDFVGGVRPVASRRTDGSWESNFRFSPGPFAKALATAFESPDSEVFLVIEEINRADAASVFGELFQLLDRSDTGASRFPLDMPMDLAQYLVDERGLESSDQVFIPANLKLVATMNIADESLRPLDAAFRRRWEWMELQPLHYANAITDVRIEGESALRWVDFIEALNERILVSRAGEDCRIGGFFIRPDGGTITRRQVADRLFPYLWSDVHRHSTFPLFRPGLDSLSEVQSTFATEGLAGVFEWIQEENSADDQSEA